ncbi:MAG: MFS transporter [Maricaulis sp.]|nr:MFS transporter [Maricaulis sp.]
MADAAKPAAVPPATESGAYRAYVLGGLFVVYTFNFIDRQIVSVLQEPIRAHFGLADWQLGLLTGPAFALLYAILGLPIAMLADRWHRVNIIAIALAIWSGFTALFGLAGSFAHLLLMRVGVGIGEAGGSPPSHSLISDYFPANKRAGAMSVYSLGIPIGSVLGILFGGIGYHAVTQWYAENGAPDWLVMLGAGEPWRAPFLLVGIPGILLAVIVKLTIKEPPRGRYDSKPSTGAMKIGAVLKALAEKPAFWFIALGAAIASLVGYGLFPWILSYFVRIYAVDVPLAEAVARAAVPYAFVVGGGGFVGTLLGGWLTDKLGPKWLGAYMAIPAIALVVALPLYVLSLSMPVGAAAFMVLAVASALGSVWYGPVWATAQNLVAPGMRAMASAVLLFVINIIGLGIGPFAIGALSDFLRASYGADALRIAILLIAALVIPAAAFFYAASRRLHKDWEAAR